MDAIFESVCAKFYVSSLKIAYSVMERAMSAECGGEAALELTTSGSSDTRETVRVAADSALNWGNGWSNYVSRGHIEWFTSSNHYVRFEFVCKQHQLPELVGVVIHDDISKVLYPEIHRLCGDLVRVEYDENQGD